jgi:hypothetical protein
VPAGEVTTGSWLVTGRTGAKSNVTAVREARRFMATDFVRINGSVEVTESHPFLTAAGVWVSAAELQDGDRLAGLEGIVKIERIAVVRRPPTTVVDIISDEPYVAEGFVTTAKSVFLAAKLGQGIARANPVHSAPLICPARSAV